MFKHQFMDAQLAKIKSSLSSWTMLENKLRDWLEWKKYLNFNLELSSSKQVVFSKQYPFISLVFPLCFLLILSDNNTDGKNPNRRIIKEIV